MRAKFFLSLFLLVVLSSVFSTKTYAQVGRGCPNPSNQNEIWDPGSVQYINGGWKQCDPTGQSTTWQTTNLTGPTGRSGTPNDFKGISACALADAGPGCVSNLIQTNESNGKMTGDLYLTGWQVNRVINGLTYQIVHVPTKSTVNGQKSVYNGSGVGTMASLLEAVYIYKPASIVDYSAYVAHNAGFDIVKPAYAAEGIGYTALTPVLKLWTLVRNIAYLAFAVLFVVIGLLIILRIKIDPKTVITVQNALPKIILSLILITFSYPIAGLLIDLMYILIGVILSVFNANGLIAGGTTQIAESMQTESIFGVVGMGQWWGSATGAASAISDVVNQLAGTLSFGGILGGIVGAVGGLIVGLAILYALVRTWFMLLSAYVNILVGVTLSPMAMLLEAIPGQSGFGTWLRTMIANLAAFPLVVLFILFGKSLIEYGNTAAMGSQTGFVPPMLGGNNPAAIMALIGLGVLLMIPNTTAMLQDWLKTPPFKYGNAWSESVGWAYGGATGLGSRTYQGVGEAVFGEASREAYDNRAAFRRDPGAFKGIRPPESRQARLGRLLGFGGRR